VSPPFTPSEALVEQLTKWMLNRRKPRGGTYKDEARALLAVIGPALIDEDIRQRVAALDHDSLMRGGMPKSRLLRMLGVPPTPTKEGT
jgi:hypothetical protein